MVRTNIKLILVLGLIALSSSICSQIQPFFKTGLNFGTINQEWWTYTDSIQYGKVLIRPVFSFGADVMISKNLRIRQEIMFQIKGQGTATPDVRSAFLTSSPDILRFMSFPLSIRHRVFGNLFLGIGIEPSLYLSGTDNYYAKEVWNGWIHSGIIQVNYNISDKIELGVEYDHDFILYYCPECEIRFYTFRIYGAYRLNE